MVSSSVVPPMHPSITGRRRRAQKTDGGPIIINGSATLNRNLADARLTDRYHLLVFPVLLGAGKRLFSDTDRDKQNLKLIENESHANGIQKLVYDVIG